MRVFDLAFDVLMVVLFVLGCVTMWFQPVLAMVLFAGPAGAYTGMVTARLLLKEYN